MILRVTIDNDNDFTQLLELFFQRKQMVIPTFYGVARRNYKDTEEGHKQYQDMCNKDDEFQDLARDILSENLYYNEKIYNRLIELFKEKFELFLKTERNNLDDFTLYDEPLTDEDIEKIKNRLFVEIIPAMINKWENDEVVYYFYHVDKFITQ